MKAKYFVLALTLLFGATHTSMAQSTPPKLWIANEGGIFSRDYVTNGTTKIRAGAFLHFDLVDIVKDNPAALAEARESSRFHTYSHLSLWLGFVPSLIALDYGAINNNTPLFVGGVVSTIATSLLMGHFINTSRQHMLEAINIYNGVNPSLASMPSDAMKVSASWAF